VNNAQKERQRARNLSVELEKRAEERKRDLKKKVDERERERKRRRAERRGLEKNRQAAKRRASLLWSRSKKENLKTGKRVRWARPVSLLFFSRSFWFFLSLPLFLVDRLPDFLFSLLHLR